MSLKAGRSGVEIRSCGAMQAQRRLLYLIGYSIWSANRQNRVHGYDVDILPVSSPMAGRIVQKALAVTLIGPDRTGIVREVAELVAHHEADWLESHLANIAGQFAGIVHIAVTDTQSDALETALQGLSQKGLQVHIAHGKAELSDTESVLLNLELTGLDQPGIVRDISTALENTGVSVQEFESSRFDGSMSGELMFAARARLRVPKGISVDDLDAAMQGVSSSLMVDVVLKD